jgi:hypothetical protein
VVAGGVRVGEAFVAVGADEQAAEPLGGALGGEHPPEAWRRDL